MNASGQVVGGSYTAWNRTYHAFLDSVGVMTDLNTLIAPGSVFTLEEARSISDNGYITGIGTTAGGQTHAFLLTPVTDVAAVPEPATIASVGLGLLAGLGVTLRRRRSVA